MQVGLDDYLHATNTANAAKMSLVLAQDITMPPLSDNDLFGTLKMILKKYGYVIYRRKMKGKNLELFKEGVYETYNTVKALE
ncbi:MAG: hypothetical protein KBC72_00410 [Acinetobacter sp.]|nr:hypothetical protein [Acinetobacter sp.]